MNQRGWEGGEGTPQGGKFWAQVQTKVRGDTGQTAKGEKKGKKEKKEKRKQGKKRAEAGGSAKNSAEDDQNSTVEEDDHPRTVERKIYRGHKTRKLRKLNDGGKLEIVTIKTHNSSDFSDMVLRPKGRKRSKNERGRRVRTVDILECEGGRLDP